MNSSAPIAEAHDLGKTYWMYPNPRKRLLGSFINPSRLKGVYAFRALHNLNFSLYPGQAIALIGKNGAGKSTALQILTGVLQPSEGEYITRGRICALLELGSGFNPDYTGRENIYMNGAILGLNKIQIENHFDAIAAFADIGRFLEQPVRTYSSGMLVRLAFSVQACLSPDILIVDEALAVGDIFFQQKCHAHIEKLMQNGTAVILVTHDMSAMLKYCSTAILLEKGETVYQGDVQVAARIYYNSMTSVNEVSSSLKQLDDVLALVSETSPQDECASQVILGHSAAEQKFFWPDDSAFIDCSQAEVIDAQPGAARFLGLAVCDDNDRPCQIFEQGQIAHFYWHYELLKDMSMITSGLTIVMSNNIPMFCKNFIQAGQTATGKKNDKIYCHQALKMNIAAGSYTFDLGLAVYQSYIFKNINISGEDFAAAAMPLLNMCKMGILSIVPPSTGLKVPFYALVDLCVKAEIYNAKDF
jgi:lipopolysaccharide transport system ATP-binding protein